RGTDHNRLCGNCCAAYLFRKRFFTGTVDQQHAKITSLFKFTAELTVPLRRPAFCPPASSRSNDDVPSDTKLLQARADRRRASGRDAKRILRRQWTRCPGLF